MNADASALRFNKALRVDDGLLLGVEEFDCSFASRKFNLPFAAWLFADVVDSWN